MKQTIAVRIGDNDFCKTFIPLLDSLETTEREFSKEELHEIISSLAFGFYISHQCRGCTTTEDKFLIKAYLTNRIKIEYIYIDKEVEDYIKECDGWDNSELFIKYPNQKAIAI